MVYSIQYICLVMGYVKGEFHIIENHAIYIIEIKLGYLNSMVHMAQDDSLITKEYRNNIRNVQLRGIPAVKC